MMATTDLLAYEDSGGEGQLVVTVPGAGDLRSENRFLVPVLVEAGYRVVNVDLPGHGDSPLAESYGVPETARALEALLDHLGEGPAMVVGCSFAPAAGVWLAVDRPDLVCGLVAISPHMEAGGSVKDRLQRLAVNLGLRGALAARLWPGLYRSWYRSAPPPDLEDEIRAMTQMLTDPARRRAVRETLIADRDGVAERLAASTVPSLTVFGAADDHFDDPAGEAATVAVLLGGSALLVEGAGHYPHVEQPHVVAAAILELLRDTCHERA